jgi:hypothetical protein
MVAVIDSMTKSWVQNRSIWRKQSQAKAVMSNIPPRQGSGQGKSNHCAYPPRQIRKESKHSDILHAKEKPTENSLLIRHALNSGS